MGRRFGNRRGSSGFQARSWPSGRMGDLLVGFGQTVTLNANQVYDYRNVDISSGGAIQIVGNGWPILGVSGNFNNAGSITCVSLPSDTYQATAPDGTILSWNISGGGGGSGGSPGNTGGSGGGGGSSGADGATGNDDGGFIPGGSGGTFPSGVGGTGTASNASISDAIGGGGGGGGGGPNGGLFFARVLGNVSGGGTFYSNGSDGGTGGTGGDANQSGGGNCLAGAGGGGGGGGSGGYIFIKYKGVDISGFSFVIFNGFGAAGGGGGNATNTGGGTATNGGSGSNGSDGSIGTYLLQHG